MVQRKDVRFIAKVEVFHISSGELFMAADLSAGGLSIEPNPGWEVGTVHELLVRFGEQSIDVSAETVRTHEKAVGLRFVQLGKTERVRIRGFMEYVAAHRDTQLTEKRRAPRMQVGGTIIWHHADRHYRTDLMDLSLLGARIRCTEEVRPGVDSLVGIELSAANDSPDAACKARVVRHHSAGFSVEFDGVTSEFRRVIGERRTQALQGQDKE